MEAPVTRASDRAHNIVPIPPQPALSASAPAASASAAMPPVQPVDDEELVSNFINKVSDLIDKKSEEQLREDEIKAALAALVRLGKAKPAVMGTIIDNVARIWVKGDPSRMELWDALVVISEGIGECEISLKGSTPQKMKMRDAVTNKFMENYKALEIDPSAAIARQLVDMIEPTPADINNPSPANVLLENIFDLIVARNEQKVKSKIVEAIKDIPQQEIDNGVHDWHLIKHILASMKDSAELECNVNSNTCSKDFVEIVTIEHKKYENLWKPYVSWGFRTFSSFAGEGLSQSTNGINVGLDWMSRSNPNMFKLLGVNYQYAGSGNWSLGARLGRCITVNDGMFCAPIELGYLRLEGEENRRTDIPLKLVGYDQNNGAFVFQPYKLDRVMNGGYFVFAPELSVRLYKGLHLVVGGTAGVVVGSISEKDDECLYTYQPMNSESVDVTRPVDNRYGIKQGAELGARCRKGVSTFGTVLGTNIGLNWTF